ncbi:exopolyphosphatase [Hydrogenophilus islandicus]
MKLAAVDLGSNTFRLTIAAAEGDLLFPRDEYRVPVRLAAGLTVDKWLTPEAMGRGWQALAQFAERLHGFPAELLRAVGTNTLRVAKNAAHFIAQGQEILGFPIEVISGREEARLIYLGVAHSIAHPFAQNLIFDIGGGSTEFIIGRGFTPEWLESLYMGCVSYTTRFFPNGDVTPRQMAQAVTAARLELEAIAETYRRIGWEQVFVSSGTARAIRDVAVAMGLTDEALTLPVMDRLERAVCDAKSVERIGKLPGMRADRADIFAGGLAIMKAAFEALVIDKAFFANGAMRLGLLYDLLGRTHHQDIREASVERLMERCQVDRAHALRVESEALRLAEQLQPTWREPFHPMRQFLSWAARLHEVGLFVAHSGYHKHGAYLLANADLPGFSQSDQAKLARWVLAHRGKLARLKELQPDDAEWDAILALRLAVIATRARNPKPLPRLEVAHEGRGYRITLPLRFEQNHPLTYALLCDEAPQWEKIGMPWVVMKERE